MNKTVSIIIISALLIGIGIVVLGGASKGEIGADNNS